MNDNTKARCFRVKLSEKASGLTALAISSLNKRHCKPTRSEFISELVELYLTKYLDRDIEHFLDKFIDHRSYFHELANTVSKEDLVYMVKRTRRQLNQERSSHGESDCGKN